jgi:hypothetical protein
MPIRLTASQELVGCGRNSALSLLIGCHSRR